MKLPDRILAVGGAGKALAYELLEAEWVLESVLEPLPDPRKLTVTIIDTAEEERNRDLERIQKIRETIEEKKAEFRDSTAGRPGEIEIEYLSLTEQISLHNRNDLLGDPVEWITDERAMNTDDWWLEKRHINENLNFATGVVRKRGLGKAIYYKAYAEDDRVSTSIDLPNKGTVAVLAGLGGGTGSGLFIDLVRDLKEQKRTAEITLFGVLPNDEEPKRENANAHAALSELEYLSLSSEDVFKNRILIPLDPTEFEGKTGNIIQSSDALEEFDRAAVYLVVAYYNMMDMEDPFASIPSYAPFVVGIPQVLRYNVDAIKDGKSSVQEMLDEKQNALESEADVYADVDRFLSKQYDADLGGADLTNAAVSDLEERLNAIRSLLDFELFVELEYHSVSNYRGIIDEAGDEADDVLEQIDIIRGMIASGTDAAKDEQFVDAMDKQMTSVLRDELEQLVFRRDLLAQIQEVEDDRVRRALSYLIGQEDDVVNPGVRLNRLQSKREEAKERIDQLESELEEAERELETRRAERSDRLQRRLDEWESRTRSAYETLESARDVDAQAAVVELQKALESYASEVGNCEEPADLEVVSDAAVREALDNLESELRPLNTAVTDVRTDVEQAVTDLAAAKRAFLVMNSDDGGILSSLLGSDDREQAERDFAANSTRLDNSGVFEVNRRGQTLGIDIVLDVDRLVDETARETDDARERVVRIFREELSDDTGSAVDQFERELSRGAELSRLRTLASEAFESELVDTGEVEERRQELNTELAEMREQARLYEETVDLFKDVNSRRDEFADQQREYLDEEELVDENDTHSFSGRDDENPYVRPTKPEEILKIQGDDDIAESRLFDGSSEAGQQERYRLRGHLEDLARRSHDPMYNGLERRRIAGDRARYQHTTVVVGVVSRAIEQIAGLADLESVFEGAYDTSSAGEGTGFASFAVEAGGSWDIGLGMFIGGVFLDNLRKESGSSSYFDGYERVRQADDTDVRVNHSFGLDEGFYVRRDVVLNMKDERDVRFFLQDDSDIRNRLLEDHLTKVQLDATNDTDTVDALGGEQDE